MTGTYRVTHCGDSISAMAWGFPSPGRVIHITNDVWRSLEHGRNAYTPGVPGLPSGSGSTWSIGKLAVERARPEGCAIIQDNGLGCTSSQWSTLLNALLDLCPANVWLIGVLPGYRADIDAGLAATVASRASVMKQIFGQHPLARFIPLDQHVIDCPESYPDGQHPDADAQDWLRSQLVAWTG